jgi:hypothetical protein
MPSTLPGMISHGPAPAGRIVGAVDVAIIARGPP